MGAVAAIAGPVIGAVAGVGGSILSSSASKSAANTQAAAANRAADLQLQEQKQVRADLNPYNDFGQTAQRILGNSIFGGGDSTTPNLLTANGFRSISPDGTGPARLTFQPTQAELEATPGYQFTLAQGLKSVQNSAAARGLGTSGAALKGAAQYATGLADNTLKTQQGIFQQNLGNVLNPLMSMANLGENAAAQTGALGTQGAATAGSGIVGAGNALGAGQVGSANALANGLGQAANGLGSAPLNYMLYSKLLGGGAGGGIGSSFDTPGGQAGGGFAMPQGTGVLA